MTTLVDTTFEFFERLSPKKRWVVGYSGGVDSTVLLHLAHQYCQRHDISMVALHINHQISQHAKAWVQHCVNNGKALGIEVGVKDVDIEPFLHLGIEGAAREVRYQAFSEFCDTSDLVLFAQHEDDQAETFLLQMARGSGPKGLSGMAAQSSKAHLDIVRPFLGFSKALLKGYATEHRLTWVEDESNHYDQFDRNFLRNQILPQMQKRWQNIRHQIAKSAQACAEESALIHDYMTLLAKEILAADGSVILAQLDKYASTTRQSFLRYWLQQHNIKMPSRAQLGQLLLFSDAAADRQPELILDDICIYRYKDCLRWRKITQEDEYIDISFDISNKRILFDNFRLEVTEQDQAEFFVPSDSTLQLKRGKEDMNRKFKPDANRPSKTLKQWCQEWEIPAHARAKLLKIFISDELIALATDNALVVGHQYKKKTDTQVQGIKLIKT